MLNRIKNKLVRLYKIHILKDAFLVAHNNWVKANGDNTLRLDYKLDNTSIVFDLGGYHGDFTEKIHNKYGCTVYVFEPVNAFYELIRNRFKDNENIKVFSYGLSDKDGFLDINVIGDSSSIYKEGENKETIELKSIDTFLSQNNIKKIDLLKINIEGGEFDILPELIRTNFIKNIVNLQIQFHTFIENSESKRDNIRQKLSITHMLTYDYYFIWENWTKKS